MLVSLVASGRKVKVSVEAIGFLVIRGVSLTFAQVHLPSHIHQRSSLQSAGHIHVCGKLQQCGFSRGIELQTRRVQGPIARVRLRELSFGRSASAKKAAAGVANAVSSFRPRIPLNCRGLELELRVPPPAPPPSHKHDKPPRKVEPVRQRPAALSGAAQPTREGADGAAQTMPAAPAGKQRPVVQQARAIAAKVLRTLAEAARWVAARLPPLPLHLPLRLAGSMALQLLLALLPSVPVRLKEIEIRFEVSRSGAAVIHLQPSHHALSNLISHLPLHQIARCIAQELGVRLGVERVVLLLHSSNMFSQLDATATVSAITAGVRGKLHGGSCCALHAACHTLFFEALLSM